MGEEMAGWKWMVKGIKGRKGYQIGTAQRTAE